MLSRKLSNLALATSAACLSLVVLSVAMPSYEPVEPANASNCIDAECSNHHGKPAPCPAGSYQIGYDENTNELICKAEPTGCPYGDSIPVDSPKCVPPEEIKDKVNEGEDVQNNNPGTATSQEEHTEDNHSCK